MKNYILQKTTLWSFPNRGDWATHKGDYRGNWSPHVPRDLIEKYSTKNDIILDCFLGSGTTLAEAKLLGRNGIGVDINLSAIDIATERLYFNCESTSNILLYNADARNLEMIKNESIDFICTHPPYSNIINYSQNNINDLSNLDVNQFLEQIQTVGSELFRVLKCNRYCSFMIGDIRKNGNVIPLGFQMMQTFINCGFTLKEIIIKEQHNCKSTNYWINLSKKHNLYLLAHEYIFVFVKK